MFCPQCRAEYRPGFTHCTDCDVDLVDRDLPATEYGRVRRNELPDKLSVLLWQGADPHFYLALIGSLGSKKAPCFGRPVNPPMYDSFKEQPVGSYAEGEFEVRVSEENLPFGQWVLSSLEEALKEQEVDSKECHPMLRVSAHYALHNSLPRILSAQIVECPCVRLKGLLSKTIQRSCCAILRIRNFSQTSGWPCIAWEFRSITRTFLEARTHGEVMWSCWIQTSSGPQKFWRKFCNTGSSTAVLTSGRPTIHENPIGPTEPSVTAGIPKTWNHSFGQAPISTCSTVLEWPFASKKLLTVSSPLYQAVRRSSFIPKTKRQRERSCEMC